MKRIWAALLCGALTLSLSYTVLAASPSAEQETAAAYLHDRGIMVGDETGNMLLESDLTRAQLAAILTRMCGNPGHVAAEQTFYANRCTFTDVPEWARLYAGYCYVHGLMAGYGGGIFGASDSVTPAAACTVTLRYLEYDNTEWGYSTACQTAIGLGLIDEAAAARPEITRGELAVMLYRALGNSRKPANGTENTGGVTNALVEEKGQGISRNEDGSINVPSDGSRYIPQTGDGIRCDDGTNYTITDVSRYDKNMFASGPVGDLPEPTCDWSLLEQPELPAAEARHFDHGNGDYLFIRNLYETRRMLYTLYNAIGDNPETWENGAPKLTSKGNQMVHISLRIPDDASYQMFWPWRESEIVNLFNSVPPGTYYMQAWDVYCNGIFQRTEYQIRTL